jgi:ACT domain-containing protein
MAELKTQVNKASVAKFLSSIKDIEKRKDCLVISEIMEKATKSKPEM